MNITHRFNYFRSPFFRQQLLRSIKELFGKSTENHISLAVVGTPSSGKSFLLMDIIDALESMGDCAYCLERYGIRYQDINNYTPDELGGRGGTPFYACRLSNHYGARMENVSGNDDYSLDFLNIPGEAFVNPSQDGNSINLSRVAAYNRLKDRIQSQKKLFCVTNYEDQDTGDIIQIVEPRKTCPISSGSITASTNKTDNDARRTRFLKWEEIAKELDGYKPVKGSSRKLSGKKLLKRFFEYDTDSIIRSIADLIRDGDIQDLGFDSVDFEMKEYDKAFVFMHYCSQATDIVVCNRIFMPQKDENARDIPFGDLIDGIAQFIEQNNKTTRAYLAFRNVDFMLYEREEQYMRLNSEVLRDLTVEEKRNVIYSIFHSSMLYHVNNGLLGNLGEYEYFVGMDGHNGLQRNILVDGQEHPKDFLQQVAEKYVDFDGGDGIIAEDTEDLAGHIKSRLGGLGNAEAFRKLLLRTGVDARNETIVPHVYFTCTPVTCEYEMYRNYMDENGKTASDFVRTDDRNNKSYFFRSQNSNVCFGSFQLCMDIMKHHKLKQFADSSLLRHLQGLE